MAATEHQRSLMEEALRFVSEQRALFRTAVQDNDLEMALRHALSLANELRSSKLTPENYYQLYMTVFWELQHFAAYVECTDRHGHDLAEVYQLVQCEGNVVPRSYLLITVGAVYVRAQRDVAGEVLNDLLDMLHQCKHPLRGLFLRYYLLQMTKDKLEQCGGADKMLQFLLGNFCEATGLWVRLALEDSPGCGGEPVLDEASCLDRSRHVLRLLVGAHLAHLAQLPFLTEKLHVEVVLPEVLRLCTAWEDPPAQCYLLECFVQVFPDRFHLCTLEHVLAACAEVHLVVDLKHLLQHLMRRLTVAAAPGGSVVGIPGEDEGSNIGGSGSDKKEQALAVVDVFGLLHKHLRLLHARQRDAATPLASLLELQHELLMSALFLHPGDAACVHPVLRGTVELLKSRSDLVLDQASVTSVVNLLASPLAQSALVPPVLAMPHHAALIGCLGRSAFREGALAIVTALLAGDVTLGDTESLRRLFILIDPLVRDECGTAQTGVDFAQRHREYKLDDFTAEQEKFARLVHQVRHDDPVVAFEMLQVVRQHLFLGGPHRMVFTLPAMVISALRLVRPLLGADSSGDLARRLFSFIQSTCDGLGSLRARESLRLWLLCAASANGAASSPKASALGEVCSTFIDRALDCIEARAVVDGLQELTELALIVGTLQQVGCLEPELYEVAAHRCMTLSEKAATQQLQCRALCLCSSLHWNNARREPGKVLTCLQRALRLVDSAVHVNPMEVGLFVEVLDRAVGMHELGNEEITAPFLLGLLELCARHLRYVKGRAPLEATRAFQSALEHLKSHVDEEQFEGLHLDSYDSLGAAAVTA